MHTFLSSASHSLCHLSWLNSALGHSQVGFCVCMYICVYSSLCMSKDTLPHTHTHIVGTWATIVCQPKQQICNGNPKLFSSTLAMSKIPLFMKISLENCYKLFMLIQIGEFQNENIIYKTMCVVSNSSHSSREVKDEFVSENVYLKSYWILKFVIFCNKI